MLASSKFWAQYIHIGYQTILPPLQPTILTNTYLCTTYVYDGSSSFCTHDDDLLNNPKTWTNNRKIWTTFSKHPYHHHHHHNNNNNKIMHKQPMQKHLTYLFDGIAMMHIYDVGLYLWEISRDNRHTHKNTHTLSLSFSLL